MRRPNRALLRQAGRLARLSIGSAAGATRGRLWLVVKRDLREPEHGQRTAGQHEGGTEIGGPGPVRPPPNPGEPRADPASASSRCLPPPAHRGPGSHAPVPRSSRPGAERAAPLQRSSYPPAGRSDPLPGPLYPGSERSGNGPRCADPTVSVLRSRVTTLRKRVRTLRSPVRPPRARVVPPRFPVMKPPVPVAKLRCRVRKLRARVGRHRRRVERRRSPVRELDSLPASLRSRVRRSRSRVRKPRNASRQPPAEVGRQPYLPTTARLAGARPARLRARSRSVRGPWLAAEKMPEVAMPAPRLGAPAAGWPEIPR